jgi:hypothetical protein
MRSSDHDAPAGRSENAAMRRILVTSPDADIHKGAMEDERPPATTNAPGLDDDGLPCDETAIAEDALRNSRRIAGLAFRGLALRSERPDECLLTTDAFGGGDDLERKRESAASCHTGAGLVQMSEQALLNVLAFANV